jgi:hypothetical protein
MLRSASAASAGAASGGRRHTCSLSPKRTSLPAMPRHHTSAAAWNASTTTKSACAHALASGLSSG